MNIGPYSYEEVAPYVAGSPVIDEQAWRVYNAEHPIRGEALTKEAAREYVNSITATRWWRSRIPKKAWCIEIDFSHFEVAWADYEHSKIVLPPNLRDKVTILHELAHMILEGRYVNKAWHGPEFAWIESQIVKRFEPELYLLLLGRFAICEVELKPYDTRKWLAKLRK